MQSSLPRISANKMAEYMVAAPARRKQIVIEQKYPAEFKTTRYRDARNAVSNYFESGASNIELLRATTASLTSKGDLSSFREQDRNLSIAALQHMENLAPKLEIGKFKVLVERENVDRLIIAGIEVSIFPLIVFFQQNPPKSRIGLGLFSYNKTLRLTKESAAYAGTLLMEYCRQHFSEFAVPAAKLCRVVDVFAEHVYYGPTNFKQRLLNLEAACEEIARHWNSLEDRAPVVQPMRSFPYLHQN